MPAYPLVLASASPRRMALLKEAGFHFTVQPPDVSETQGHWFTPSEMAMRNAWSKARLISAKHPSAIVIGADTLVCRDAVVFGKPRNETDAIAMLERLQGKTHRVVTGVCLCQGRPARRRLFAVTTDVIFRALARSRIISYLKKIHPYDKAGAYAIQEHGDLIIERIEGSFSNVVGLPLERLREELARWNIQPTPAA
jgi:septum formation protein